MAIRQRGGSGPAAARGRGAASGGREVTGPCRGDARGGKHRLTTLERCGERTPSTAPPLSCYDARPVPSPPRTAADVARVPRSAGGSRIGTGGHAGDARCGAPHRRRPFASRSRQGLNARAPAGHALSRRSPPNQRAAGRCGPRPQRRARLGVTRGAEGWWRRGRVRGARPTAAWGSRGGARAGPPPAAEVRGARRGGAEGRGTAEGGGRAGRRQRRPVWKGRRREGLPEEPRLRGRRASVGSGGAPRAETRRSEGRARQRLHAVGVRRRDGACRCPPACEAERGRGVTCCCGGCRSRRPPVPLPCRCGGHYTGYCTATAVRVWGSSRVVVAGKGPLQRNAYAVRMLNKMESEERHLSLADRELPQPSVQRLWMYRFVPETPGCAPGF